MLWISWNERGTHFNSPVLTPTSNVFPCSDGFIQITGLTDGHAAGIVAALDLGGLNDPRLKNYQAMSDHHDEVKELCAAAMRGNTQAHWMEKLAEQKVPHAPIRTYEQVLADPQLVHRGIILDAAAPTGTPPTAGPTLPIIGQAFVANEDGPDIFGPPPRLGEHVDTVMAQAGYSADEVAKLRGEGVFG